MDIDSTILPRPTLLDRLGRNDADWMDIAVNGRKAMREAVNGLLEDLRRLLNTRRPFEALPARFGGLEASVVGYGLPDSTHVSFRNAEQRARFRRELEAAITMFEPRLGDVRIEEVPNGRPNGHRLSFRITAMFQMEGEPVPIVFDTTVNDARDRIAVEPADGSP